MTDKQNLVLLRKQEPCKPALAARPRLLLSQEHSKDSKS
jgi:hypothetical protein